MADSAAFTPNLQYHPSIFEISASEFLDQILYPALSKICDFCGLKYNFKSKSLNVSEDLSPVITFALQYFYLRKQNASFGENFYGLQRLAANGLPLEKRFNSALVLALLPYLERKLKARAANHEMEYRIEKIILNCFNLLKIAKAINILTYLAKISSIHSPIYKILGLQIAYSPPNETKATSIVLKSIELFAFFLQFMQWWYTRPERRNVGNLKNPPCFETKEINLLVTNAKDMCPVCLQKITIPTASSISGYVYCWKCIVSHLKEKKMCPVTNLPMNFDDLVRIYDS